MKRYWLLFFLVTNALTLPAQETIRLYDVVPNNKNVPDREKATVSGGVERIENVSIPTLTMYKANPVSDKGTAIIICPGGGYSILAFNKEGVAIAKVFQEWGITAFVLKYRLPDDSLQTNKEIVPLQDAQRAIQMVRQRAGEWGINPNRIGIMGFSAGGHLAATASTHFLMNTMDNPLAISLRPDFSVLMYPVISFTDSLGHIGSRNRLIGNNPSADKINLYSNEMQINAQTPPAFIVHAADDNVVKVMNSVSYYEALIKNKVPAEMHLYQAGGHGFGLNNPSTQDKWSERLKNWLTVNKYL